MAKNVCTNGVQNVVTLTRPKSKISYIKMNRNTYSMIFILLFNEFVRLLESTFASFMYCLLDELSFVRIITYSDNCTFYRDSQSLILRNIARCTFLTQSNVLVFWPSKKLNNRVWQKCTKTCSRFCTLHGKLTQILY
jgi:hypothetical protein